MFKVSILFRFNLNQGDKYSSHHSKSMTSLKSRSTPLKWIWDFYPEYQSGEKIIIPLILKTYEENMYRLSHSTENYRMSIYTQHSSEK